MGQPCLLSDCLWPGGRLELLVQSEASFGFACDRLCFVAMGTVRSKGVEAEPGSFGVGVAMLLALALAWRLNESG